MASCPFPSGGTGFFVETQSRARMHGHVNHFPELQSSSHASAFPVRCRSGAGGFLLPLSGGADSSSVCAIVGCMCQMVMEACQAGDEQALAEARRQVAWN